MVADRKERMSVADKYCVMHQQKFKRADVKGLQAEANREWDDPGRYKNNVDLRLSGHNYYFARSDDWQESISKIIEEEGVKERPNSVVLVNTVYSASPEWMESASVDQRMDYFRRCYEWECDRTRVISAVIHVDEGGTWHLQTAGVPITDAPDMQVKMVVKQDKKGNTKLVEKREPKRDAEGNIITHRALSAKALYGNRVALSRMQDDFAEICGIPCGLERGECRLDQAPGAKRHQNEREYAVSAQEAEIAAQKTKLADQAAELENLAKSFEIARKESKTDYVDSFVDGLRWLPKAAKQKIKDEYRMHENRAESAKNHAANVAAETARQARELKERLKAEAEEMAKEAKEAEEQRRREKQQAEADKLDEWAKRENERLERLQAQHEAGASAVRRRDITLDVPDTPVQHDGVDYSL